MIARLRADAVRQEAGDIWAIGEDFDDYDAALPRGETGAHWDRLHLAFYFWDCWIDARNHEWLYHEPIREQDWPRLARHICEAIENESEVTDTIFLEHFGPQPVKPSLMSRLLASVRST